MADPVVNQQIIDYYTNLLIIQYNNLPKATAMVAGIIAELNAEGVMFDVRDGYDINTAVGAQLDILGKYIGVNRFYNQTEFDGYFAFTTYDEVTIPATKIGFSDYADFPTKPGLTLLYSELIGGNAVLDDDSYRIILKLKIIQNNSNHSHQSIDADMFNFFGTTVIPDSAGNMAMVYFAPADESTLLQVAIQKGILPKPMGVRLSYIIKTTSIFFGFATYTSTPSLATGFSTYTNFGTKVGETLTYNKLL